MNVFEIFAKFSLDSSEYESGLDKAKGLASGAAQAAGVALAAATTAVVGFGKSSVEAGMSFDSSMSQVAATMGLTVDEIGELRDFAQDMGSTTAFSATQAADALNFMALAGYDADTSMEMLPNVLNLAAAGGIELARASDMVTDAQSALGLSLDETSELVNKMAMASSTSNTSVAQLGDAILTVGGTAKNLAGGTTELSTALGILADNGIKGAEGGTALRNVILSLSAPTGKAGELMDSLGLKVYDTAGNMRPLNEIFEDFNDILGDMTQGEQTEVLNEIFNKVDLKSVTALLANTTTNTAKMSSALLDAGIAWDKYSDKYWMANSGLEGMISEMIYNIKTLGTSAEDLQDYLHFEYDLDYSDAAAAIEIVSGMIDDHGNRWDKLAGYIDSAGDAAQEMAKTQLDNLAGDITLFQSALEGAQIAVSDRLTPTLREFVQFGTDGLSELTAAFRDGGLTGAMEALGTLISDGLAMLTEQLPLVVNAGMQLLSSLVQGIIQNLPALATAAVEIIAMLANGIADDLPALIPTIVEVVLQIVKVLTDPDNLSKMVESAITLMTSLMEGLIAAIPVLLSAIPEIISNLVQAAVENAPKMWAAAAELIAQLAMALIAGIPELLATALELVVGIASGIVSGIDTLIQTGGQLIDGLIEGITGSFQNLVSSVTNFFREFVQSIKNFLGIHSPSTVFSDIGKNLITGLINGINSLFGNLRNAATNLVKGLVNAFANVPQYFMTIGKNIITGLVNGFTSMISTAVNSVRNFAGSIVDAAKSALGVHSPSTVFAGIGENLVAGLENGWGSEIDGLKDQINADLTFEPKTVGIGADINRIGGLTSAPTNQTDIVTALQRALQGMQINMDGYRVGYLTTNYQASRARALGV